MDAVDTVLPDVSQPAGDVTGRLVKAVNRAGVDESPSCKRRS